MPGSNVNPINLRSSGVTPIALLSTATFDATKLAPTSLRIGPNNASVKETTPKSEDVNGDGLPDQVVHVVTKSLGLTAQNDPAVPDRHPSQYPHRLLMRPDPDRLIPPLPRRHTMLRALACAASIVVGVFVVLGCLLALRLEADGFGRPRDTGMRPGYVAALTIGATAGVVVPAGICLALLKGSRRLVAVVAGAAAIVVAVSLFGAVRW